MKTSYQNFPGFSSLSLEDSYVIDVKAIKPTMVIKIEAALTSGHQLYKHPKTGEAFCYINMDIVFSNVISIKWVFCKMLKIPSSIDKLDDYGNVDFLIKEDESFRVGGEWGEIIVMADMPNLRPSDK